MYAGNVRHLRLGVLLVSHLLPVWERSYKTYTHICTHKTLSKTRERRAQSEDGTHIRVKTTAVVCSNTHNLLSLGPVEADTADGNGSTGLDTAMAPGAGSKVYIS